MITVEHVGKQYMLGEHSASYSLGENISRVINPKEWFKKKPTTNVFFALEDINFTVNQGEVLGLIGRNGAGKSTLLKILSQITPPSTGKIKLNGRVASLLEVGTGFHPELTGRENIFLNGAILGMTKMEIKRKFDEIVDFAEIEQFLDTPVKRYSSGMYVRLAFAVAAHLEPEILLVDEVLAVGDVGFQKKCIGKMSEVTHEDGRTLIFVSHNLGAIQKLCSRTILLSGGKIVADGPTDQTITAYLKDVSSADAEVDLSVRSDRQGNGNLVITKIFFQNTSGEAVSNFQTGHAARMVLEYASHIDASLIKNVTISLTVSNQMGELILNLYNVASSKAFDVIPPQGRFIIDIENLALMPGTYYFNSFVTVNKDIADWVLEAGSFNVDFGDFYGTGQLPPDGQGNFLLKHKWSVE